MSDETWCVSACVDAHIWEKGISFFFASLTFVHACERVLIKGGQALVVRPLTVPSL